MNVHMGEVSSVKWFVLTAKGPIVSVSASERGWKKKMRMYHRIVFLLIRKWQDIILLLIVALAAGFIIDKMLYGSDWWTIGVLCLQILVFLVAAIFCILLTFSDRWWI